MLCQVCIDTLAHHRKPQLSVQKTELSWWPKDNLRQECNEITTGHHVDYASFARSVTAGCQFYVGLQDQFPATEATLVEMIGIHGPETQQIVEDQASINFFTICSVRPYRIFDTICAALRFAEPYDSSLPSSLRLRRSFFLLHPMREISDTEADYRAVTTGQVTQSSTTTMDKGPLDLVRRWLDDCINNHSDCRGAVSPSDDTSWYPTRLLDLGDLDRPIDCVKLIHTSQQKLDGPYVTLSHRWGTLAPIQLSHSNIASYCVGIQTRDLPKTFQEAVFVTKHIGFRYLWIDSLCIRQDRDDLSDWFREAGLMHKVYAHAVCNLSAADSVDSAGGLSRVRSSASLCVPILTERIVVWSPRRHEDIAVMDHDLWRLGVEDCPVNQRGWVMQERLLAPRILHFGKHQLFWECRTESACEQYPGGLPSLYYRLNHLVDFKRRFYMFSGCQSALGGAEGIGWIDRYFPVWAILVRLYSSMSLTKATDRLVAISAVAKSLQKMHQDRYLAGLWHQDLELQLLWNCLDVRSGCPYDPSCPKAYCAPTWSWASVDGIVNFPVINFYYHRTKARHRYIDVAEVSLTYKTGDVTGSVAGGWLDLQGYLRPLELKWKSFRGCNVEAELFEDEGYLLPFYIRLDVHAQDPSSLETKQENRRLFFMVALGPEPAPKQGNIDLDYYLILLLQCTDEEKGYFERFGVGFWNDVNDVGVENLLALSESKEKMLPCLSYQDGRHTIRMF